MKFFSKISLSKNSPPINYESELMLLGSCFAEHMAAKLNYYQFRTLLNPLGILFHSLAIEKLLNRAVNEIPFNGDELVHHNEQWHCLEAHSVLSNTDKPKLLNNLNTALKSARKGISNASHIIITLGTSWVYRSRSTGEAVANCHKIQQKEFIKELLSVEELQKSLERSADLIRLLNKDAVVIFTVSPVRHLKDGIVENSLSKAQIISAIHKITDSEKLFYFPSFELMMDELRDYRYYKSDLIHPNDMAIEYIWDKFKSVWIEDDCHSTMKEVNVIRKGLQHRPFNPESNSHKKFLTSLQQNIEQLKQRYPFMDFTEL